MNLLKFGWETAEKTIISILITSFLVIYIALSWAQMATEYVVQVLFDNVLAPIVFAIFGKDTKIGFAIVFYGWMIGTVVFVGLLLYREHKRKSNKEVSLDPKVQAEEDKQYRILQTRKSLEWYEPTAEDIALTNKINNRKKI